MSLSSEESAIAAVLSKRLAEYDIKNADKRAYYEGKNKLKDLRISIPPQLAGVETVVGWARTAVQVLEERLEFEGWYNGDDFGLNEIYRLNNLDSDGSLVHNDALVYGVGYIVVGAGNPGEPTPLITVEPPSRMTSVWDLRRRRVETAMLVERDEKGKPTTGVIFTPDANITVAYASGDWVEVERDEHRLGRVLVAQMTNQPSAGSSQGRSEITPAVKYLIDSAMRTFLGAEVSREFYSAPQRYVLGAREDLFQDEDGNPLNSWSVIQGRLLGVPYNEEDSQMPQVGQFSANSPEPYMSYIRALATQLAAETAIPPTYLGFQTDNPSSADAIRQMEARLVKRAERRQRQFGNAWTEVARLSYLVANDTATLPEGFESVRPVWRDASTPTRAAAADEVTKLIAAGVLPATSEITLQRIGLSEADRYVLREEIKNAQATNLIGQLAQAAGAIQQTTPAVVEVANTPDVIQ
jgi:hypothetical protein